MTPPDRSPEGAAMTESRSLSGKLVRDLTLDAVRRGEVSLPDLRIHPETLDHQASVAEAHGNPQLAENLRRAAELTVLPDDEVLAIYEALRPHRSTPQQLTALAESLAGRGLPRCARHTVSAVAGICSLAAASAGSEFAIALRTAGGAAVVPASPVPLTPSGLVRHGTAWCATANAGRSPARGIA